MLVKSFIIIVVLSSQQAQSLMCHVCQNSTSGKYENLFRKKCYDNFLGTIRECPFGQLCYNETSDWNYVWGFWMGPIYRYCKDSDGNPLDVIPQMMW